MNVTSPLPGSFFRKAPVLLTWGLIALFAGTLFGPAVADEKIGMPDLAQIEQTCLPTSTANLMVWFGQHGYPRLIASDDSREDGYIHTVHHIMNATDARFDWGTRPDVIVDGIKKYVEDAGYSCDVEFRGIGMTPFTQDWLKENDQPNKGFILLLAYCNYDPGSRTFTDAWEEGHAVTLVNAEPDMILVHDPAHMDDESGRKVLTPEVISQGTWRSKGGTASVAGLLLLSGSMLDAPPNAHVMLIGAVCVTMHPDQIRIASAKPGAVSGATPTIGGGSDPTPTAPSSSPAASPAPASATKSWTEWLFNLLFSK